MNYVKILHIILAANPVENTPLITFIVSDHHDPFRN